MADSGYVYALINPSMPNLVKIGRTERAPEERAQELSSTGIPTQFVVAYSAFFHDCSVAENYLHQLLQVKGYRLSQNREFFSAPLQTVIDAILEAKKRFSTLPTASEQINTSKEGMLELKALKDRAAVGTPIDFYILGRRYLYGLSGVTENKQLAVEHFKQGAHRGCGASYARIALMLSPEILIDHVEKCWRNIFRVQLFRQTSQATEIRWRLNILLKPRSIPCPLGILRLWPELGMSYCKVQESGLKKGLPIIPSIYRHGRILGNRINISKGLHYRSNRGE